MEMFFFGVFAGMILTLIMILVLSIFSKDDDEEIEKLPANEEEIENLLTEMESIKVITGLSRYEREKIEQSNKLIEKAYLKGN